jgi:hypothetical protein
MGLFVIANQGIELQFVQIIIWMKEILTNLK